MPELPDITVYLEALARRITARVVENVRIANPFVLRTAIPPIATLEGRRVVALRRLGKRVVIGFEGDLWLVIHLMIAGRLHWLEGEGRARAGVRGALARFDFGHGTLVLTEAGTKRRASLHVLGCEADLRAHDRGGLEVIGCDLEAFRTALTRGNHTLKRALTDPVLFSGIGNAYSDEILHTARLSPVALTHRLSDEEIARLHAAAVHVLEDWTDRLRRETGDGFPGNVTAFRPDMAVHGRFGKPCPVCGSKVQRIRYAENEVNYCPRCQTGGRLLADRSLSRLLKSDWPRTIEEAEAAVVSRPPAPSRASGARGAGPTPAGRRRA